MLLTCLDRTSSQPETQPAAWRSDSRPAPSSLPEQEGCVQVHQIAVGCRAYDKQVFCYVAMLPCQATLRKPGIPPAHAPNSCTAMASTMRSRLCYYWHADMKVSVINRQRRTKVDTAWLRETAEQLAREIATNLTRHPAPHLASTQVRALAGDAELSVVLVSNQSIRKLNREWRGKDSATDVLSFPLSLEAPPAGLPFELGEIVISVERAAEQAETFGHSLERELAFLFVHGTLHILGFDHETPEDEKEMFSRQKKVLDAAGFKR